MKHLAMILTVLLLGGCAAQLNETPLSQWDRLTGGPLEDDSSVLHSSSPFKTDFEPGDESI